MNGCSCNTKNDNSNLSDVRKQIGSLLLIFIAGVVLYFNLQDLTDLIIYKLFGLAGEYRLTKALHFFIFEVPKVLMLLTLIVFVVGIIRSYFSPEKTRKALEGKPLFIGNIMAASLGIVTPFCSCSAIPLFIGFMETGIPVGVTFSFLISAPMINEVALVLLFGLFGWKVALVYVSTGLFIAITAGWIIGKLNVNRFVESWVFDIKAGNILTDDGRIPFSERLKAGTAAVREIVAKVWIYIVIGVGVGSFVHGYVPENFMASIMGKSAWWSVPLAVIIGVPLYSNAAGVIPILQALIAKGASLGTALAFIMSVIGLSLPEMIILKKVIKLPLIIMFVSIVATGITIVGYLFNFLF